MPSPSSPCVIPIRECNPATCLWPNNWRPCAAVQLDADFMVQVPPGPGLDNMLVAREELGVLLSEKLAARLTGVDGVRLDAEPGWIGSPSRARTAQLGTTNWPPSCAHTASTSRPCRSRRPIPDSFGHIHRAPTPPGNAFALAPRLWAHASPGAVVWSPVADHPVVRSTWAVWPASSRRRDVCRLITAFEQPTRRQDYSSTAVATSEPCCDQK